MERTAPAGVRRGVTAGLLAVMAALALACTEAAPQGATRTASPTVTLAILATRAPAETAQAKPTTPVTAAEPPATNAATMPAGAAEATPEATTEPLPSQDASQSPGGESPRPEAPSIGIPEAPDGEDQFRTTLSPEDQNCLPEQASTRDDVRRLLDETSESAAAELFRCMSSEGQFQVYMLDAERDGPRLTVEQHRCIWEGMRSMNREDLGASNPGETDPEEAARVFGSLMFGIIATTVYCAGPEALTQDTTLSPDEKEQMQYLWCIVDEMGGPSEFTSALTATNGMAEVERRTTGACGTQPDG